jgi:peptidoglycan hydrolase CwlO-like protein
MNQRALLIATVLLAVIAASIGLLAYNQSSQIVTLESKRSELATENADLSQKTATLTSEKDTLTNEKAQLIENVSNLQEQLVQASAHADSLMQNLSKLESENTDLKNSLASSETMISSLKKDLADAKNNITQLNKQISNYLTQIISMNTPIDERHLNATLLAQQNCSQCHSQVVELALTNQSNRYHNLHFNNPLLNFTCTDCHKSVDISANTSDLAKIVDIPTCKECHTTFPPKVWMGQTSTPEQFALQFSDCTRCHSDWTETMAKATFVNLDKVTEADCTTCHLKNAIFPTERMPVDIPCNKCH